MTEHKTEIKHESREKIELADGIKKSTTTGLKDGLSNNKLSDTKDKKEEHKEKKVENVKAKKHEAYAIGKSIHVSKKHSMALGRFIKNKTIDSTLIDLGEVIKMKKVVPFKGEIPHRKGDIMSGRYPVNAAKAFIQLIKGLRGNALVNGLDLSKTRIESVSATWDARPTRSGGRKGKRSYIVIKARELSHIKENKNG